MNLHQKTAHELLRILLQRRFKYLVLHCRADYSGREVTWRPASEREEREGGTEGGGGKRGV